MELSCPHIIWKIFPFNSTNNSVTKSFDFFNCAWRWEYSIHTELINEVSEEIVSIYLKRLTNSSSCSLQKVSAVVSIKGTDNIPHAARIKIVEISPLVSWCVWQKPKSFILTHNVLQNNSCSFSLTLEPSNPVEDPNSFAYSENYDASCLQEFSKDFDKFLKCSRHTDIILKCNNTEIKAHKDVLCFRSKKFTDMIENKEDNFEDTSMKNVQKITLESMDPVVFVILLRFIYTFTLPDLTNELARKIYEAADDYGIDSLKKKCARFIIEHLCNSNALEILIFANEHSDGYLKWAVSSYIVSDINILHSDEWREFAMKNPTLAVDVFKMLTERVHRKAYSENTF